MKKIEESKENNFRNTKNIKLGGRMKTRFNKKLVLNKATITNLDLNTMKHVNGGTNFTTHELCSQHPIFCNTAPCPSTTVDPTIGCSDRATCGEFTCYPQFTVC
jgi:hypothetical protein